MTAMATDGDPRRGSRPHEAEAKTEALTPERRAELMAAAEAQFKKDSRTGSRASSQPAVRINTARNKVEPLQPGVKTESGLHASPGASASGLPAIPPPPDDRTEAISKEELRQRLKSLPSEPSGTDTARREAGFDETAAGDDPALEPTIPPQLDNVESPPVFESDATVAFIPEHGFVPHASSAEPEVDRTANDLPMPTLTAPPAPALADDGPSDDDGQGSNQPAWLGNARPVDLQRPPSGAPSEFGDVATGLGPAPLPGADDDSPLLSADDSDGEGVADDAAAAVASATPHKRGGCGAAMMVIALFAVVGLAAGGTVAAMLWGDEILVAVGLSEGKPSATPGDGDGKVTEPPDEQPGEPGGNATVTGNRAIKQPPADAVHQTAVRVTVVDDLSESGYALADPFGKTVAWRLRGLGPFQIVDGAAVTNGVNLSLFLKKINVHETEEEQVATAWCGASVQTVGDGGAGEPNQLKATATERGALPDVDDVEDDALEEALHPHRYRLGGAAALGCAKTLAELVAGELKVEGPPSAPDAPAVALPETVPPMKAAPEEPAKVDAETGKKKKKKTKKKRRKRKKKSRKKHKRRR
jgi:hypothetical protein